jgi:hypothetical protein
MKVELRLESATPRSGGFAVGLTGAAEPIGVRGLSAAEPRKTDDPK